MFTGPFALVITVSWALSQVTRVDPAAWLRRLSEGDR